VSARKAVAQRNQHGAQLLALVAVEPGEKCVFALTLSTRGATEVPLAGRGAHDDVAAAVYWAALA
jgi:hypothetical protein